MGKIRDTRYTDEGYSIAVSLSQFSDDEKYKGYTALCQYKYKKKKEKYLLSMWLKRDDISDRFKIDSQEIDTQYISGTRDTIRNNICLIVEQACNVGFFDKYIERFEYTYKCFDKGDDLFMREKSLNAS